MRSMSYYSDPQSSQGYTAECKQTNTGSRRGMRDILSDVIERRCSSCPCHESYISLLLLSGSFGSLSVHLQLQFSALQRPSPPAALSARPRRSERVCLSATAGSNRGNHQFGPGSCFWTYTGIDGKCMNGRKER